MREIRYAQLIAETLDKEMERDENIVMLGEDIGFIGGNFKCTEGLLEKYGDLRVKDTPISEQGFVGMGVGMALTGLRPVIELMFSDFLLVAADQVINQMAKIRYMSGGQCNVPMTIRCPIGAGRFRPLSIPSPCRPWRPSSREQRSPFLQPRRKQPAF